MNVILLGPPGAGKGTMAAKIKEHFGFEHLSTGDMLRAEMKNGTELGNMAKAYIDEGKLVPDSVIIGMVKNRLENTEGGILFDGFPRTVEQAKALSEIAEIDAVVNLDTTVDVVVGRICSRRLCKECGAVYSTAWYSGSACEKCGGALYIRDDDTEETVVKRFEVYQQQTAPLVEFYQGQGKLHTIDANGAPDEIAKQIRETLEGLKNE